jgi:uncharacterized membrane protein YcaP (DUF421 family)
MLLASTLIAVNWIAGWLTYRSKVLEALIEGRPVILIHDGHVNQRAVRKVKMTMHELDAAIRAEGCAGPENVRFAVLENNGRISVLLKSKA